METQILDHKFTLCRTLIGAELDVALCRHVDPVMNHSALNYFMRFVPRSAFWFSPLQTAFASFLVSDKYGSRYDSLQRALSSSDIRENPSYSAILELYCTTFICLVSA